MAIESLDACEDLAIVPAGDQNLSARPNGSLEDREGSGSKLVLLDLSDFILTEKQSA